jgi:Tol biopolymer transport system component
LGSGVLFSFSNISPDPITSFISRDGRYLIFCSRRPGGFGEIDLYISFHKGDGSWTTAVNLGKNINSPAYDWIPFVSEVRKFLFFTSNRTGNYDIYWVDAQIIEELKPKE